MAPEDLLNVVHGKHRIMLSAMLDIFGDDANTILNALHEMAARVAIATGTPPEEYSAGMKYHWDKLVNEINRAGRH